MTFRLLVTALGIGLAGCASEAGTKDTAPYVNSSTTVAEFSPEKCAAGIASRDIGTPIELFEPCVNGWATGQETAYMEECRDCESVLLLHFVDGVWRIAFNCNQYADLLSGCTPPEPDGITNIEDGANLPSLETACRIWDYYTWSENIVSGGCFGPPRDLRYDEIPRCGLPYRVETYYPIYLCQKGETIRAVQGALKKRGHSLSVDGEFGPGTLRALIAFQIGAGMPINGAIDLDLINALELPNLYEH